MNRRTSVPSRARRKERVGTGARPAANVDDGANASSYNPTLAMVAHYSRRVIGQQERQLLRGRPADGPYPAARIVLVDDGPLPDVVDDDANRELATVIEEVGQHETLTARVPRDITRLRKQAIPNHLEQRPVAPSPLSPVFEQPSFGPDAKSHPDLARLSQDEFQSAIRAHV